MKNPKHKKTLNLGVIVVFGNGKRVVRRHFRFIYSFEIFIFCRVSDNGYLYVAKSVVFIKICRLDY